MEDITEPIILRPKEISEEDTFHLFSIMDKDEKGKEVERKFFARKQVSPAESLRAMHIYRTQGETAVEIYGLELVLGKEGYAALMNYDALDWEELEAISKWAGKVVGGKGKGPNGSPSPGSQSGSRKSTGSKRLK